MSKTGIGLIASFSLLFSSACYGEDLQDVVESTFLEAVVKIDVSSNTPVIRENTNICVSEGTGFLVTLSHLVTAEHVYALPPECGDRIIIVKSKANNLQRLATVVAAKDDVALLKVDTDFPDRMCALGLRATDVYDSKAIRFGIPGGFSEPPGAIGVKIGREKSDFSPLIVMMPTATEKGESGGPVIYQFNVVGLTRAKHDKYPAYSFMTAGSNIRSLMAANSIYPEGHICNPVESGMWTDITPTGLDPFNNKSLKDWLGGPASKQIAGAKHVGASIKINKGLVAGNSSITSDLVKNFNKSLTDSSLTVNSDASGTEVAVQGRINKPEEESAVTGKVARATAEVSMRLQKTLWDRYVAEGDKAGKWKNAIIIYPPAHPTPRSP